MASIKDIASKFNKEYKDNKKEGDTVVLFMYFKQGCYYQSISSLMSPNCSVESGESSIPELPTGGMMQICM